MKILILSPNSSFGGASTANQNIAYMLAQSGHTVVYADEFNAGKGMWDSSVEYVNLPVYRNRLTGKSKVASYILKNGFDMVICGVPQMMAFYLLHLIYLRLCHKVKLGIIFHSLCLARNVKSRIFEFAIAFSTLFVDRLYYVSEYTKNTWEKFVCVRVTSAQPYVIHNAVPESPEQHVLRAERPVISLVGRLSPEKRPDIFCIYAEILHDRFDFRIWGDGPLYEEYTHRYDKYVKFMGYEDNIRKIYADTDILMVTSEFENCPMVILEARSYGVPVLTVNVGGISEIVTEGYNGSFFDVDDSADIILRKLCDMIANYSSFQANCRNSVITFANTKDKWNQIL